MRDLQEALFTAVSCMNTLDLKIKNLEYKLPFGDDECEAYIAEMLPNELTLVRFVVIDVTHLHNLPKGKKRFNLSFIIRDTGKFHTIRIKDRNTCLIKIIKKAKKINV